MNFLTNPLEHLSLKFTPPNNREAEQATLDRAHAAAIPAAGRPPSWLEVVSPQAGAHRSACHIAKTAVQNKRRG
jgi:hypothetical protein